MKKAQGLSLNTIIIAAIVLIVLIVLWAIFTGRMGAFTSGVREEEVLAQQKAKTLGELAEADVANLEECKATQEPNSLCKCGDRACKQPMEAAKVCVEADGKKYCP